MIKLNANTFWLDLHGVLMFVVLLFSAFLVGCIYFVKDPDQTIVYRLKVSAAVSFLLLIGLMISGIVPDTAFGSGSTFSYRHTNDLGTFISRVTDGSLGNFTGPLLFDMMEHVSLIVPGLAAVIVFLIWYYGPRVMTQPVIRNSTLGLMVLTGAWMLVLGMIGIYITKVLTFPVPQ
jgi:hypothetical protein